MAATAPPVDLGPARGPGRAGPVRLARRFGPVRILIALTCAFFFLWPVVMVAVGAFRTALPGQAGNTWTAGRIAKVYTDGSTYSVLWQTVVLAVSVTVLSTLIALFFAWVVARTDTPLRQVVTPVMVLVLAMPPMFFAIAWDMLGNKRVGMLNQGLAWITGSDAGSSGGPFNVESWYGLILVCSLKAASFSYFMVLGPFLTMDRSVEEASLISGAGRIRTFFRIHIPMLTPAISSASLLTLIAFLEGFDIPAIIGLPAGIRVLPTQIYNYINATFGGQYAQASSLALMLIALVTALIVVQAKLLGRRRFTTISGKTYRTGRWRLGPARWACTLAIVVFTLLALVLPLVQLYLGSLQPFFGLFQSWTLDNYHAIFEDPEVVSALENTAYLAVFGGLAAIAAALVLTKVVNTTGGAVTRFISFSTWMPMALPGVVLGLGMMWSYLTVPGLAKLYATVWILLIGLFVSAIPVAMRSAEGALVQVPGDLEEAARMSGAGRVRAFCRMVIPLITPSLLSGWLLAGILIAGNLAVPVLLASPDSSTVSVVVLELYKQGDVTKSAAVFCVILTVLLAAGILAGAVRGAFALRRRARHRSAARAAGPSGTSGATGPSGGAAVL
ncbi:MULTISPECIES: ABC transporter permease [Actinomadura]|uniref:ABC transporter permease n=1 Tax=Actinomadura yumaensis TaxID=111807 RepID=A0ABW2CPJ6_9ACTN|nr:iron ABC transporter permease [Actinomadura sp. J1-007]MWK36617.1 ABC transporter permease subunit [Actinomadura sp. J1-007]